MREEGEGYGNGAGDEKEKKKKRVHVSLRWKQGNMESNLSQHPEIVPVDKLISLNINAECFIPWRRGPGAPSRNALNPRLEKFPPNHQIWQQRKTQIDSLNELNTHAHAHTARTPPHTRVLDLMSLLTVFLIHLSPPPNTHGHARTHTHTHTFCMINPHQTVTHLNIHIRC